MHEPGQRLARLRFGAPCVGLCSVEISQLQLGAGEQGQCPNSDEVGLAGCAEDVDGAIQCGPGLLRV